MQDLIEKLKQGSQDAFQALVTECSQSVIHTCYALLHNTEDAEDMAQEVFIEVYRSIKRFRHEADLRTWIYRISINKSLDLVRKRNRKKRLGDLRGLFQSKTREVKKVGPHRQLEEKERKQLLLDQIGLLAENQRIALVLSQFEKLNNKEIGEVLGVSEGAVEGLLHRARANLKKKLAHYFEKKGGSP